MNKKITVTLYDGACYYERSFKHNKMLAILSMLWICRTVIKSSNTLSIDVRNTTNQKDKECI